jgi:hypothetical protein
VAWRSGRARPIVFEAPHPFFDAGTLEQSVFLFDRLHARALVASGTHRCASAVPSGCDGTTEACGNDEPVRESDMAHNDRTFFQHAHAALADSFATDLVVSVHGMAGDGVSLSDGTTRPTTADADVARLRAHLAAELPDAPITTCNDYPGAPAVEVRLCGGTNVQGRHLNGSADPCRRAPAGARGRFIHMEQSRAVRDRPAAVARAFERLRPLP